MMCVSALQEPLLRPWRLLEELRLARLLSMTISRRFGSQCVGPGDRFPRHLRPAFHPLDPPGPICSNPQSFTRKNR